MMTAPFPAVARAVRVEAAGRRASGAAGAESAGARSPAVGVAGGSGSCGPSPAASAGAATSATADASTPGNAAGQAPVSETVTAVGALAGKRFLTLAAGTPDSRPSSQMVSVGNTLPDAASSASSFPDTGPLMSEPRP